MIYLNKFLVALVLINSPAIASTVAYQDPVFSKIERDADGNIIKIIMPDGRILMGSSGTICVEECPPLIEELETPRNYRWAIPVVGAVVACAALCNRGSRPTLITNPDTPPTPPTDPPTAPVPEPISGALVLAGLPFLFKRKEK